MATAAAEADAESLLGLSPRTAAALAWGGAWVTVSPTLRECGGGSVSLA